MDRPPIDFSRPPFPFVATDSPREAAAQLVAAFRAVGEIADRVGWVHRAIAADIGPAVDAVDRALLAAGSSIAAAVDADAAFHDRHAYHNRQHYCEVMLTVHVLCRRHGLPQRESRLALLAALVHDLEHDGGPGVCFAYERRSVGRALPHLAAAGVDAATTARLAALVLATEPRRGVAIAIGAHRWHLSGGSLGEPEANVDGLDLLTRDAALAQAAVLLCEADVLPSIGLTLDHALALQDRLSAEWRRPLNHADKLRFLDDMIAVGVIGPFFLPNLRALRQSIADAEPR